MVVSILSASFVSDAPFLASRWQSIDSNPSFNWICSGNLCSIFEWLIMMLKLFMKLSQHQNSSIQGSYMFLTTTSIFVRQALLPLVALSNYQLKKFYCNFRQIIHTDWDTPTRFLSSCYPNHQEENCLCSYWFHSLFNDRPQGLTTLSIYIKKKKKRVQIVNPWKLRSFENKK